MSHWRVANVLEKLNSPDAIVAWRKAHDTLAGLSLAGVFVSPQDQQILEQLRDKLQP